MRHLCVIAPGRVTCSQYGKDYVVLEDKARLTHKGIWAGKFTQPALWRKQQKAADAGGAMPAPVPRAAPAPASTPASSGLSYAAAAAKSAAAAGAAGGKPAAAPSADTAKCNGPVIKGNINAKGARVYHTVESPQYTKVRADRRACCAICARTQGCRHAATATSAAAAWLTLPAAAPLCLCTAHVATCTCTCTAHACTCLHMPAGGD